MLFTLFLAPAFLILFLINPIKNNQKSFLNIKINGIDYSVELADSYYKKSIGLMFRHPLDNNLMLFPYKKSSCPVFYNKNVRFPVRIYFLDKDFNIVSAYIMPKNSFKLFKSKNNISYVLEVGLGSALIKDFGDYPNIKMV